MELRTLALRKVFSAGLARCQNDEDSVLATSLTRHHHMGRTLKVHLTNASPDLVHDFRNFGEDVYRALRNDYAVSIAEIDGSMREFHLREIPKREVRTVAARIHKLVERYSSFAINVDEIREGDDANHGVDRTAADPFRFLAVDKDFRGCCVGVAWLPAAVGDEANAENSPAAATY